MPTPFKLTEYRIKVLCEARAQGLPLNKACEAAGFTYESLRRWRAEGQTEEGREVCKTLVRRLAAAERKFTQRHLRVIQKFIEQPIRTKQRTRVNKNKAGKVTGSWEESEVTHDREAAARFSRWLLSKTDPDTFGDRPVASESDAEDEEADEFDD